MVYRVVDVGACLAVLLVCQGLGWFDDGMEWLGLGFERCDGKWAGVSVTGASLRGTGLKGLFGG